MHALERATGCTSWICNNWTAGVTAVGDSETTIACAVSQANRENPAEVKFAQECMRAFFTSCIYKRHLDLLQLFKYTVDQAAPRTVAAIICSS